MPTFDISHLVPSYQLFYMIGRHHPGHGLIEDIEQLEQDAINSLGIVVTENCGGALYDTKEEAKLVADCMMTKRPDLRLLVTKSESGLLCYLH